MKKKVIATILGVTIFIFGGCDSTTPAPSDADSAKTAQKTVESNNTDIAPPSGSYEINDISVTYYAEIENDATGNWRLAIIDDTSDLKNYVGDFYKKFVTNNSEILGIVNLGLKTTTRISMIMPGTLDITIMEYINGEEHDANILYSGKMLDHFWFNIETGEVDSLD